MRHFFLDLKRSAIKFAWYINVSESGNIKHMGSYFIDSEHEQGLLHLFNYIQQAFITRNTIIKLSHLVSALLRGVTITDIWTAERILIFI